MCSFLQVHGPLWKIDSQISYSQKHKSFYYDSDRDDPPDEKPESLPLYAPWLSPSPPREDDGEEEDAGDDEEVLCVRRIAPAALQ